MSYIDDDDFSGSGSGSGSALLSGPSPGALQPGIFGSGGRAIFGSGAGFMGSMSRSALEAQAERHIREYARLERLIRNPQPQLQPLARPVRHRPARDAFMNRGVFGGGERGLFAPRGATLMNARGPALFSSEKGGVMRGTAPDDIEILKRPKSSRADSDDDIGGDIGGGKPEDDLEALEGDLRAVEDESEAHAALGKSIEAGTEEFKTHELKAAEIDSRGKAVGDRLLARIPAELRDLRSKFEAAEKKGDREAAKEFASEFGTKLAKWRGSIAKPKAVREAKHGPTPSSETKHEPTPSSDSSASSSIATSSSSSASSSSASSSSASGPSTSSSSTSSPSMATPRDEARALDAELETLKDDVFKFELENSGLDERDDELERKISTAKARIKDINERLGVLRPTPPAATKSATPEPESPEPATPDPKPFIIPEGSDVKATVNALQELSDYGRPEESTITHDRGFLWGSPSKQAIYFGGLTALQSALVSAGDSELLNKINSLKGAPIMKHVPIVGRRDVVIPIDRKLKGAAVLAKGAKLVGSITRGAKKATPTVFHTAPARRGSDPPSLRTLAKSSVTSVRKSAGVPSATSTTTTTTTTR